jgi:hypothetical protein
MAYANLTNEARQIDDGLDSIVIIKDLADIPGGRTLDVSGMASGTTVIKAGHIIMKDDTSGEYEPLGLSGTGYKSTTTGKTYVGVLKKSILLSRPLAAILTMGQVNATASPYAVTSTIKAALPNIQFL